jgi:hypothetical protein
VHLQQTGFPADEFHPERSSDENMADMNLRSGDLEICTLGALVSA